MIHLKRFAAGFLIMVGIFGLPVITALWPNVALFIFIVFVIPGLCYWMGKVLLDD